MKKLILVAIAILITFSLSDYANSQTRKGGYITSIEYNTTFNMGRASDFLSNPGFWAGSFQIKSFVKNNLSIGVEMGLNVVSDEEENGTTELSNGTLSGPQARYLNYTPVFATLGYHFNKTLRSKTIPYIQANVGAYYIWQRLQVGANIIDNDNWHFGLSPEVGVIFNLGSNVGLTINGRYNYAFSSGEPLGKADNNAYSFFNANIGIAYLK